MTITATQAARELARRARPKGDPKRAARPKGALWAALKVLDHQALALLAAQVPAPVQAPTLALAPTRTMPGRDSRGRFLPVVAEVGPFFPPAPAPEMVWVRIDAAEMLLTADQARQALAAA